MAFSERRAHVRLVAVSMIVFAVSGCFGEAEDEDGLSADVESNGWDVTVVRADGTQETYHVRSDPHEPDADGDALDDEIELLERTDPNNADTDGDGLVDGEDVVVAPDSKKSRSWTDKGYVYEDQDDFRFFLGERGNHSFSRGGDPRHTDSDKDGLVDGLEAGGFEVVVNGDTRIVRTHVIREDTDGDILWDGHERESGLDPTLSDTDLDRVADGVDLDPWRDLHARFVVESLDVTTVGDISFRWLAANILYDSPVGDADDPPATFSSDPLDLDDANGNMRTRQHNATMGLSATIAPPDGEARTLDLFSDTTGGPFVNFRTHVRDATMRLGSDPPGEDWPESGRFSGPDGSVVFRIIPSGPEGFSV